MTDTPSINDVQRRPGIGHNGGPSDPDLTEIRLQLFARGYRILPNECKIPVVKQWSHSSYLVRELTDSDNPRGRTALEKIEYWQWRYPTARSTGVRIESSLRVIDIDVGDGSMVAKLLEEIRRIAPDIADRAPMRFGAPHKMALFCRLDEHEKPEVLLNPQGLLIYATPTEFIRKASGIYHRPGDNEEVTHAVEIFGGAPTSKGNCSRQFGIYGPHSYNEDGSVAREYEWADDRPALHEIDLVDLPVLSRKVASEIIDAFRLLAHAAGWIEIKPPSLSKLNASSLIYDIDENSRFNLNDGSVGVAYCDLYLSPFEETRCSSSFIEGDNGSNTTKCWVFHSPRHDCIAVYNHETGNTHYPKNVEPFAVATALGASLRKLIADLDAQQAAVEIAKEDEITRALKIWEQSKPLCGTPAGRYLEACGVKVPKEARRVLRYHAAYPGRDGPMPALVALVSDIVTDEPIGIQVTALSKDGTKLGCRVVGSSQGGAIKLTPIAHIGPELAIGVGLENTLSAQGLGVTAPLWALCGITGLSEFPVLPRVSIVRWTVPLLAGIEQLVIISSNDADGASQKAAGQAKVSWEEHGLRVKVLTPRQPGWAFCDLLKARGQR